MVRGFGFKMDVGTQRPEVGGHKSEVPVGDFRLTTLNF